MLALLLTPINTTTCRGAGQELMDLLKLEITFIAGWIYRQRGPPSLSLSKGQLERIFCLVCWPTERSTQAWTGPAGPAQLSNSFRILLIDSPLVL